MQQNPPSEIEVGPQEDTAEGLQPLKHLMAQLFVTHTLHLLTRAQPHHSNKLIYSVSDACHCSSD